MSRIQQCYFCEMIIDEPEYFMKPEEDAIYWEVVVCLDCYERRSKHADFSTV